MFDSIIAITHFYYLFITQQRTSNLFSVTLCVVCGSVVQKENFVFLSALGVFVVPKTKELIHK